MKIKASSYLAQTGRGIRLSDAQRLEWLRLIRTESIGPKTFRTLLNRYGTAGAALEALPAILKQKGRSDIKICSLDDAKREWDAALKLDARLIALGEAEYPTLLRGIDAAPPLLAIRGKLSVLHQPCIAMVGARNASALGMSFTERLAKAFGEAGLIVVSGLARGIDTRAHHTALSAGTIGVLAGGLDRPYPPENIKLMEMMLENGAVVSEQPFGWEPRGADFPRRNRIIAGLSYGTLVVEAARKSGSLITARFANEQGRQVFAVPGSPLDPRAEGTNDLLAEGAIMVRRAEDVIDTLAAQIEKPNLYADLFSGSHLSEGTSAENDPDVSLWDELLNEAPTIEHAAVRGHVAGSSIPWGELNEDPHNTSNNKILTEKSESKSQDKKSKSTPCDSVDEDIESTSEEVHSIRRAQSAAIENKEPLSERDKTSIILSLLSTTPVDLDELTRASGLKFQTVQALLFTLEMDGLIARAANNCVSLCLKNPENLPPK